MDIKNIMNKEFIEWNENELSVGIQEIDEQHKILIRLINSLYQSVLNKETESVVVYDVLRQLTDYTVIHFAIEESLMRIFEYPNYEDHKKQHKQLTQQVKDLREKLEKKETFLSMEVMHFLCNWLSYHIAKDDKQYSKFFLERGLRPKWAKRHWSSHLWNPISFRD